MLDNCGVWLGLVALGGGMCLSIKRFAVCLFLCVLGVYSTVAKGMQMYYVGNISNAEFMMLPGFCRGLVHENETGRNGGLNSYDKFVVSNVRGLHHYCAIPIWKLRYYGARDVNKKNNALFRLIDEANYVIRAPADYSPLLGSAYLERARAMVEKKQVGEAMENYYKAIELSPNDAAAYLELARIFSGMNNTEKALEVLTNGLRRNPVNSIKRLYSDLGGKEPFPTPNADKNIESDVQVEKSDSKKSSSIVENEVAQQNKPATISTTPDAGHASGKNPYCRFCP